jgi:FkbM family methyltransferase
MISIDEHALNESILKKDGWVLDLGCVGFNFAKNIKQYVNNVIAIDANPSIVNTENVIFENIAITSDESQLSITYNIFDDSQGNSLYHPINDWCKFQKSVKVPTTTIKKLMEKYNVNQFELIKLDIEGSEYDLLMNLDFKISKQYSIEFHEFRGMNPYTPNNEKYYDNLFKIMKPYCDIIKHQKTNHPGFPLGLGLNYWDSLFILKEEFWK